MDALWETDLVGLTRMAVSVTGQWTPPVGAWDPAQGAAWAGQAVAPEPLVAIQLVATPQYCQGVKSAKYAAIGREYTALPLTIVLHAAGHPPRPSGRGGHLVTLAVTRPVEVVPVGGWVRDAGRVLQQLHAWPPAVQISTGRWTTVLRTPELCLGGALHRSA